MFWFFFVHFFSSVRFIHCFVFFFSSRRRHTRSLRDWVQTCALPIYPCSDGAGGTVSCTPSAGNAAVATGGYNQTISSPNTDKMGSFIIRVDYKMNDKMNLSGRYMFADSTQSAPLGGYTLP